MKKEKYLQIFRYLKEFSKLRSNPVRDINIQETQYPEKIWLHEIPLDKLFDVPSSLTENSDRDYWLKIRKPIEPNAPEFPLLPVELRNWINPKSLLNGNKIPELYDQIELNGKYYSLENEPRILREFERYLSDKWRNDFLSYSIQKEEFELEYSNFTKLDSVYRKFFNVCTRTQQFEEEYELVLGVGLLKFQINDSGSRIFRHVLTQKVDVSIENIQNETQIIISPNLETGLSVETDFFIDLVDFFDPPNIIAAEKQIIDFINESGIDGISNDIEDVLKIFIERICPDGYYESSQSNTNFTPKKPTISSSPALLLRKRDTHNFTVLYDRIIERIEKDVENLNLTSMNDLIEGAFIGNDNKNDRTVANANVKFDATYFPKEHNQEQLEIVEKTKKKNKVLVQGPPGTGKSHTIANLICHLLATGNRILVTAYTKRALEVLKDKLPNEFKNLTVNLLSSDSSSLEDLQTSVNGINEELSYADVDENNNQIEKLESELDLIRRNVISTSRELINEREKDTLRHSFNKNYAGTLSEIAEKIESDSEFYQWYKDDYSEINNKNICIDLISFYHSYKDFKKIDAKDVGFNLPEFRKLVGIEILKEYNDNHEALRNHTKSNVNLEKIASSNLFQLEEYFYGLQKLNIEIALLENDFVIDSLKEISKNDFLSLRSNLEKSKRIFNNIDSANLKELDKDIEVKIPLNRSLKQIKGDAHVLLDFLLKGNKLSGLSFALKRPLLPNQIKEKLYFLNEVFVNGSPCDTIQEFQVLLNYIVIKQEFIELSEIWQKDVKIDQSYLNIYNYFIDLFNQIELILGFYEKFELISEKIKVLSNLRPKLLDDSFVNRNLTNIKYSILTEKCLDGNKLIKESISYLKQNDFHPIKLELIKALDSADIIGFETICLRIEKLRIVRSNYNNFIELQSRIEKQLPITVRHIRENKITLDQLDKIEEAFAFRDAQRKIAKFLNTNSEIQLETGLKELEINEKLVISKLASKKAWNFLIGNLQNNRSLRQHLEAWVLAERKIGKTGKGKRASKFRRIAQKEMENCKDSVPCWIMPLYKVAETIVPSEEMYDYVIVDEASQLGPEAIFLLYISKKIIIVGDDKQTSPEYVGIDSDIMTPHIKRFLKGIPRSDFYGTEFSFFDHAKFFCDGVTVLREHFRCMPEIIEFSNRHFYAPSGKGLFPLKQYSEDRLPPLMKEFCKDGYTEGKGANIINQPEAKRVVDVIAGMVEDMRYRDKTIGVIVLQGNTQARLIENLLLKRIGEKEYFSRKIVCGSSASFQGDERDVILLSLVTAINHNRAPLVKSEDERRFNVAVSRAKEQIWLVHSVKLDDLGNANDLRYKLLDHFYNYNSFKAPYNLPIDRYPGTQPAPFDSWFEVDVYNDLTKRKISVIPQYEVANGRYRIDLVALLANGAKLAIECDGDKWHGPEQHQHDLMRQRTLERCGWQFFRIRGYEYYLDRAKALEPLWRIVSRIEETAANKRLEIIDISETYSSHSNLEITLDSAPNDLQNKVHPESNLDESAKIICYLNFFENGTYMLLLASVTEAIFSVPIKESDRSGFLLQCYKSGHINKVQISDILSKKIGKEYINGVNPEGRLVLVEVIDSEKIIGISFLEEGVKKFKAHLTNRISARDQMNLLGYKVMYNDFDNIEYTVLPVEIKAKISRLIFQSFSAAGKQCDSKYYLKEFNVIKSFIKEMNTDSIVINEWQSKTLFWSKKEKPGYRFSEKKGAWYKKKESIEQKGSLSKNSDSTQATLFDTRVELNSLVKIKNQQSNKVMNVFIAENLLETSTLPPNVQPVLFTKPLAKAILGKLTGDIVGIPGTKGAVQILSIEKIWMADNL